MTPLQGDDLSRITRRAAAMSTNRTFVERTGREIFGEHTISGMNRLPINTLLSFIVGGTRFEKPPFDIEELAEYLLVEGSVLIVDHEIQCGVVSATQLEVVQQLDVPYPVDGSTITRVYQRTVEGTDWTVTDYIHWKISGKQKQLEQKIAPAAAVIVYPNGKGVLFPVQKQLWRIERIYQVLEKQTTGQGLLKKLVSGYLGDINTISDAAANDDISVIGVPGGDLKGLDLATDVIVNTQTAQLDRLEPVYLRNVHVIGTVDASSISGLSRQIFMTPMTTFVEKVRGWIIEICALFNYEPSFESLPVKSVEEKQKEYDLLKLALTDGVITREEFAAKARELTA